MSVTNKNPERIEITEPNLNRGAVDGSVITDTDRINWLEARPLPAGVHGGSDDGADAKFWGIGAYSGTLRETIDHMITTGSERKKNVET